MTSKNIDIVFVHFNVVKRIFEIFANLKVFRINFDGCISKMKLGGLVLNWYAKTEKFGQPFLFAILGPLFLVQCKIFKTIRRWL